MFFPVQAELRHDDRYEIFLLANALLLLCSSDKKSFRELESAALTVCSAGSSV